MYYNKLNTLHVAIIAAFTLIFCINIDAHAQPIASRSLEHNFDQFEFYRDSNTQQALHYAELILSDLDSTIVSKRAAELYDFIAQYNEMTLHKYRMAQRYLERSRNIYTTLGDTRAATRTKANLGRLYLRNGDYHNAYSHSIEALNIGRELGDSLSVREAYLALEQVTYHYHHDYDMAMRYNRYVADSHTSADEAHQSARALNNRFNYEITTEQVAEIVDRSVEICTKYGFHDQLVNIYLNLAMYELQHVNPEIALTHLNMAKSLISNFKEEGYYYSALGFYHLYIDDTTSAIKELKRSIELLNNGDFDSKNVHSYFLLQDIYRNEGRYREAYDALMAFSETYTRQHNTDNIIELSLLINDMEMKQAAKERARIEQEHLTKQKHAQGVFYSYILTLLIVISIGALIYSRYRLERKNRQLQREQAEQDLRYKNEIIKIQRLQQYQERNNMDKLSEELNHTVNIADNREMRAELRRVIRQLQQRSSDNDWADVELTLASADDTLIANLLKDYPNLTKNERKLCTLTHMNLSTKEIANITHQSTGSINVARSRLRQKFGLTDSGTSLIAFLDKYKG